jgi:dTDP-glucose 4,6-dehydratase
VNQPYQPHNILVTGGAGFIGSAFIRHLAGRQPFPCRLIVLDHLTYAGNMENIAEHLDTISFVRGDICEYDFVLGIFREYDIDTVVHFAAESHVDRSLLGPLVFTRTNVLGTHALLEAARQHGIDRFIHISTDEVYGSLGETGSFAECDPLDATSPYAASKAASDLIVLSYAKSFGLPAIITRCSNNYGPYQFPEKFIPLMIVNALRDMPLPVYGDGLNVREWIHTDDHVSAILAVLRSGRPGEVYNIGSGEERRNIDVTRMILSQLGKSESLIRFVSDRPAHDRRYAINSGKLRRELQWSPSVVFEDGIADTIGWYHGHCSWWERVMTGEYRSYYDTQYSERFRKKSS